MLSHFRTTVTTGILISYHHLMTMQSQYNIVEDHQFSGYQAVYCSKAGIQAYRGVENLDSEDLELVKLPCYEVLNRSQPSRQRQDWGGQ